MSGESAGCRHPVDQPLGAGRGLAADHAYGGELRHLVGKGKQPGHRAKGDAAEVAVQPCDDDLLAGGGQPFDDLRQPLVEELSLLDGHDVGRCHRRFDLVTSRRP